MKFKGYTNELYPEYYKDYGWSEENPPPNATVGDPGDADIVPDTIYINDEELLDSIEEAMPAEEGLYHWCNFRRRSKSLC